MTEIELVDPLVQVTGGVKSVKIENADTVLEAVRQLTVIYPDAAGKFLNGDSLSRRIIVYMDDTDIRLLHGDSTALNPESKIRILTALTGG